MNHNLTFGLIIIYIIVFFSIYKYLIIKKRLENMANIKAICTDIIVRHTYNKKYYIYCYTFKINHKEYSITDKFRLPLFAKKIVINNNYSMYVNLENPNDYLTPIETMTYKWYLYFTICLIIILFI